MVRGPNTSFGAVPRLGAGPGQVEISLPMEEFMLKVLRCAAILLSAASLLATSVIGRAQAQTRDGTIAIIGTGSVAETLGMRWAQAGHTIVYGSRTPDDERVVTLLERTGNGARATTQEEAVRSADIVLLAVPGTVGAEVAGSIGDLAGKILIDPTNTLTFADGYFVSPTDPRVSLAERIQEAAPGAVVVKAFNTTSVQVMENPGVAGGPVTIPLSGDDAAAKERVAGLVSDLGLEPLDVGPLASARFLEEMLRLYIAYRQTNQGQAFEFYLRPYTP
jgi:8-hydroxy-5-deazaflavin:NADPH oxidoreductase